MKHINRNAWTFIEQFADADRLKATVKENLEVLGYG